jgi:hypothetical protein
VSAPSRPRLRPCRRTDWVRTPGDRHPTPGPSDRVAPLTRAVAQASTLPGQWSSDGGAGTARLRRQAPACLGGSTCSPSPTSTEIWSLLPAAAGRAGSGSRLGAVPDRSDEPRPTVAAPRPRHRPGYRVGHDRGPVERAADAITSATYVWSAPSSRLKYSGWPGPDRHSHHGSADDGADHSGTGSERI